MSSHPHHRGSKRRREFAIHVVTDENAWRYVREIAVTEQLCDLRGPDAAPPQLVVPTLVREATRWLSGDIMLIAVATSTGEVAGAARLSTTLGPSQRYERLALFGRHAVQRMPSVYIWDGFDVVDFRHGLDPLSGLAASLLAGLQSYALKSDVEQLIAVVNMVQLTQLLELGWNPIPLGTPREAFGSAAVAVSLDVSELALRRTRSRLAVAGPPLVRHGLSRRLSSAGGGTPLLC